MNKKLQNQSGQIGLVVLLISAVLVTLGIGVASQSILQTKTARQETESTQAFDAAEQDIENALANPDASPPPIEGYNVTRTVKPQTDTYSSTILEGHSMPLNLEGVNSLALTWTDNGDCEAELVVAILKKDATVSRGAYSRDCDKTGDTADNFDTPTNNAAITCDPSGPTCKVTLNVPANAQMVRIKTVYGDTTVTAQLWGANLPSQGNQVTAVANNTSSGETRAVQVDKGLAVAPSIFDYVLFAGQGDIKQEVTGP